MEDKPTIPEKGRYQLKFRGIKCLNCEHPLDMSDKFCPSCSQANSTKKLSLKDFFDEFFSSLISYDSKLLRTLSALLLKPGKITRDYINGKRVSYTNPFRFLLSLAIVYFLIINYTGNFSDWDRYGKKSGVDFLQSLDSWKVNLNNSEDVELGQDIDSLKKVINYEGFLEKKKKKDSLVLNDPKNHFNKIISGETDGKFSQKQEFFYLLLRKDSIYNFDDAVDKYGVPKTLGNKVAFNASNGLLHIQQEPGSFLSMVISKLPFAIFFFLPVFAFFIWLIYIRKKYNYIDHLIFSFHNTSLLFILLIISYLIDSLFTVNSGWIFLTIFSVYLFRAMKKFYDQGLFKTTVKYLFLNSIFFILALFMILILFTGNLFTY